MKMGMFSMCPRRKPWLHSNDDNTYHTHQDDIEEAFVVKQILQHLAAKHGINFHEMAFKEEKMPNVSDDT